ncbi:E1B 55K [Human mastadenovirus C]|uniref:E1B 55 kDa protein n=1 Tax=Human mastadenovirus C TaxID=129951 RepID=A0A3Q9HLG0_9ADEN|nr:E1B 55K [Human mastadenovirus C]AZR67097.1 E1B 55K [Human mastadenovirus C]AZR67241.1 E1B 55K [Human mastadenovirus C]AZR67561.1 E1B 55K [Human mastadenovirus C]WPC86970.1 transformation-associated protein 55 kDa [Human adenovirus 1]
MERRNPSERGVPAGFSGHAFVESSGETQESLATVVFRQPGNNTDGGAAAATAAAGGSQAAAAAGAEPMEPESRPGPSGMNVVQVAELFPELRRILTINEDGQGLKGVKRERGASEATEEVRNLTFSLMTRHRPECVTFQQIKDNCANELDLLAQKYSIEQLTTYWLQPGDDFEEAIRVYAKVALRPDCKYKISKLVNIRNCCYISGNGAEVEIDTEDRVAFRCSMINMWPGVLGMDGVVIMNVRFTGPNFSGTVFLANTNLILHGVSFYGFNNTCVEAWTDVRVRGCAFYCCWKGVVCRPKSRASIKKCLFERCTLGILSEGNSRVRHNVASDCGCFMLVKSVAVIKHNMVCGNCEDRASQMLTCSDGNCHLLKTIHVASHSRKAWPVFEHNILTRCSLHLGNRRGVFLPYQCNLSHTKILLEPESMSKVNLNGVFDMTMKIWKVLRYDETRTRCRPCECGGKHIRNQPVMLDVTEELRPDHLVLACTRAEFGSSDEDTD